MNQAPAGKPFHCLVWIDHQAARIYAVTREALSELATIHAPDQGHGHVHHRAGTVGPGHEPPAAQFLEKVAAALKHPAEVLIAGPADIKHALKTYIAERHPGLDKRIMGVETLDKVGPGELHDFASRFFHRADRMHPLA